MPPVNEKDSRVAVLAFEYCCIAAGGVEKTHVIKVVVSKAILIAVAGVLLLARLPVEQWQAVAKFLAGV